MGLASAKIIGKDHDLILCDLNEEHLKRAQQELADLGIEAETMICDVSNQSAVEEAILYAAGKGHLASIIHTAGVSPQMGKADLIMKINALGTIYITEAFLKVAKNCRLQAVSRPQKNSTFKKDESKATFKPELC